MKRVLAFVVLLGFGMFGGLGGCKLIESPEDDMCAFRTNTCVDNCIKRALGRACEKCCGEQGDACIRDAGNGANGFSACMN